MQLILVAGVALGQWPGQEGGKLPWWMDPNIIDFDPKPPRVPEADARSRFLFSQCITYSHHDLQQISGRIQHPINCFSEMSIVRLKQGGKYLAMENRKFKLVDSETACADMEQFVMTMDRVNQHYYPFIHIVNSNISERVQIYGCFH